MSRIEQPNEIYIRRVYNAPVTNVWSAWVDPAQKALWWGPRGFTITTHSSDIRTGGAWNYTMHGPDGTDYPNNTTYHEVKEFERLVYDHGASEGRPPLFRVTVEFIDKGDQTEMEMVMALPNAEAAEQTKKFIKEAGGDGTWDRLAEHLSAEDIFVINRSFHTSIDKMFDAWTDPAQVSEWLPPTGATMTYKRASICEGGDAFYSMSYGDHLTMYGKAYYREVSNPNCLVYTQSFCDESENISRHPMAPTWPETMVTKVQFAEETATRTRVTVTWAVEGEATGEERATFHNAKNNMAQGWGGSFDKLEDYIGRKS